MHYGSFKSYSKNPENNNTLIFGCGSFPISIKIGSLITFANSSEGVQGYKVGEVKKMIATMLTGWDLLNSSNVVKPKSMSDNYIELVLSCDNGFVVKKRLQFPHIIAWQDDSMQYNIADVYKQFSIDNWIKADDFATPDITLAVIPTDEIIRNSGQPDSQPTTDNSGMFYIFYRNLPVGINRIRVIFHIKTQTEPINFDLEVKDGNAINNSKEKNANILFSNINEIALAEFGQQFKDLTPYTQQILFMMNESSLPNNKITHDLFFYPYV